MCQIGTLGIEDQTTRGLRLVQRKMANNQFNLIGTMAVVVRHTQRIPGDAIHRLQFGGVSQSLGSSSMFTLVRQRQSKAIPGAVVFWIEFAGATKRTGGSCPVTALFVYISQIEPGIGMRRIQTQRPLEPFQCSRPTLLLRVYPGHTASGTHIGRIGAQCFDIGIQRSLGLSQPAEKYSTCGKAEMIKIHDGGVSSGGPDCGGLTGVGQARIDGVHPHGYSMQFDLLLISLLRVIVEVAGFALLGRGVLALLAGKSRHENIFYKILETITHPAVRAVRWIAPRFIIDAHVPMLTFFLLFWIWIALAIVKRYLCGMHGLDC